MLKRLMLLINPAAGRGGFKNGLGEVLEIFYRDGYLCSVYFTGAPGDAAELVVSCASDYDLLVCIGGDGTLSEVISGLMELERRPPLGYLPMGTANDVATTLKLSRNAPEAARKIVLGRTINFDVGVFGDRDFFTYIAAFGAFTDVSYETPQQQKRAVGQLAYILEGMTRLNKLSHYTTTVEHDGGTIQGDFIFGGVTNSTSIAGMVRLNDSIVDLSDGLFELILVRNPLTIFNTNHIFSSILSQNYDGDEVQVIKSSYARFTFNEPVAWTRDGENGGRHSSIEITNRQGAIKFIV